MKLDTTSYYPASPLGDEPELPEEPATGNFPEEPVKPEEQEEQENSEYTEMSEFSDPDDTPRPVIDAIAHIASWVLVPLMMPLYGIILIFSLSILSFVPEASKWAFTAIVALFNMAVPAILVLLLKRFGIVHDIGLNGRKERLIPYIITILCMGGTAWFLHSKGFPMWVTMFYAGGAVAGVIEFLINFKWKISAHCAAIAGIVALLVHMTHNPYPSPYITVWLVVAIFCAGLLGSARLWLRRHTLAQVLAGYSVGFLAVYLMMFIH